MFWEIISNYHSFVSGCKELLDTWFASVNCGWGIIMAMDALQQSSDWVVCCRCEAKRIFVTEE